MERGNSDRRKLPEERMAALRSLARALARQAAAEHVRELLQPESRRL